MSKKILIVDDEPDVAMVLAARFETYGYQVEKASSGREALKKGKAGEPDLIIMDIMMPDVDGVEAAALFAKDNSLRDIPIIFLTALQTKEEERKQGREIGRHTVFAKPFEFEELLEKTKQLIG